MRAGLTFCGLGSKHLWAPLGAMEHGMGRSVLGARGWPGQWGMARQGQSCSAQCKGTVYKLAVARRTLARPALCCQRAPSLGGGSMQCHAAPPSIPWNHYAQHPPPTQMHSILNTTSAQCLPALSPTTTAQYPTQTIHCPAPQHTRHRSEEHT